MYKIPINKLPEQKQLQLFSAMGNTKKGRIQLANYKAIESMGLFSVGACFMMDESDYKKYINNVICEAPKFDMKN